MSYQLPLTSLLARTSTLARLETTPAEKRVRSSVRTVSRF